MLIRSVAVIVCLGVSFLGIIPPFMALWKDLRGATAFRVALDLVMVHAWVALVVMSLWWIADRRLPRFWPVSGTIAGGLSVLAVFVVPAFFVLPAIALACWVSAFHFRRPGSAT